MKEIREIIKAYDAATQAGKKSALAAVVHVNGSSYRRPGARMLVTDEGELTGAISGGCLEGDALRKALLVLSQQKSRLVTYDTNNEDDATIGIQLGCAGVIQVLFEPIHLSDDNNPIQLLRKAIAIRQQAILITLFSLDDKKNEQAGTCMLMEKNGNISGEIPFPDLKKNILADAAMVLQKQKSSFKNYKSDNLSVTAFIEFLQPPVSLVVVGAGNDAIPMMQIADTMGWDVRIIDGRSTHARPERFVSACQVLVSKPEKVLEQIPVDERTAFVLMTHNYNYDLAMLRHLLFREVMYIGLLGPKLKLEKMLNDIKEQGMDIDAQHLKKVFGPVGLAIGAETAEEIAVSIIAEIQAVVSGEKGGLLRDKHGVIHSRGETITKEKTLR